MAALQGEESRRLFPTPARELKRRLPPQPFLSRDNEPTWKNSLVCGEGGDVTTIKMSPGQPLPG